MLLTPLVSAATEVTLPWFINNSNGDRPTVMVAPVPRIEPLPRREDDAVAGPDQIGIGGQREGSAQRDVGGRHAASRADGRFEQDIARRRVGDRVQRVAQYDAAASEHGVASCARHSRGRGHASRCRDDDAGAVEPEQCCFAGQAERIAAQVARRSDVTVSSLAKRTFAPLNPVVIMPTLAAPPRATMIASSPAVIGAPVDVAVVPSSSTSPNRGVG